MGKILAKYCSDCGKLLENENSKFCNDCGAQQATTMPVEKRDPSVESGNRKRKILFLHPYVPFLFPDWGRSITGKLQKVSGYLPAR
jgi:predicted amidophosphoribosyltransferase